jgi:peptidoglycan/xylan/chitin deacetylase (PgdA/CDA1 family)
MRSITCICLGVGICIGATLTAAAAECPENPQAIGTSRTIAVTPMQIPRIGTEQYASTLPLRDHEIVLSFDDGPSPELTNPILDVLDHECVKATFFVVGEMAKDAPEVVQQIVKRGHTVGTHTQTHAHLVQLPFSAATAEIEDGIKSANAAIGRAGVLAPFFRAPYLESTSQLESYIRGRGLSLWSIDFDAEDWTDVSPDDVVTRVLSEIEKRHKGILLLHDIQQRTLIALPKLLQELKIRGYQIAQVVPADTASAADTGSAAPSHPLNAVENADTESTEAPAAGKSCSDNPNAIGTSRVLAIDPAAMPRVGTVNFPQTLPLSDHEIVLTFDDGPLPPYTNEVLDTLAEQCVKATFFMVGEMATDSPDVVRRVAAEGHTIGTLTQSHADLSKGSFADAKKEIETGIKSVKSALEDARLVAPFFRNPYLQTTSQLEAYLASQGLSTWSIDFQADDWQDISPEEVVTRALGEIEKKQKGILELYDIQQRTALALPKLLNELKRRNYRIVHVVPITNDPAHLIEPRLVDLPHPALGQELTPSPTARRAQAGIGVRARSARKGAEVDKRTGHADRPHPALGQDLTPSPTTRRAQAETGVRARSARKGELMGPLAGTLAAISLGASAALTYIGNAPNLMIYAMAIERGIACRVSSPLWHGREWCCFRSSQSLDGLISSRGDATHTYVRKL